MSKLERIWLRPVVVFDLDGTLVDTLADLHAALDAALAGLGHPLVPASLVRESLHDGLAGSARAAARLHGLDEAQARHLLEAYRLHYEAYPARYSLAYPGAVDIVRRLQGRGCRLGICTNKPEALAREVLRHIGLLDAFAIVVGAAAGRRLKPDPQPLLLAIAGLAGCAGDALLVGDSAVDAECAHAAGVDCLIHTGGYGAGAVCLGERLHLFDAYSELLELAPP